MKSVYGQRLCIWARSQIRNRYYKGQCKHRRDSQVCHVGWTKLSSQKYMYKRLWSVFIRLSANEGFKSILALIRHSLDLVRMSRDWDFYDISFTTKILLTIIGKGTWNSYRYWSAASAFFFSEVPWSRTSQKGTDHYRMTNTTEVIQYDYSCIWFKCEVDSKYYSLLSFSKELSRAYMNFLILRQKEICPVHQHFSLEEHPRFLT